MIEVRVIGGLFGVVALAIAFSDLKRYRRRGLLRIRDLLTAAIGAGLISLAVAPRWFDTAMSWVGVESLQGRRVAIFTTLAFVGVVSWMFFLVGRVASLHRQVGDLALAHARSSPVKRPGPRLDPGFIAVVLPAFNEEATIAEVLKEIPSQIAGRETLSIVVSDGSTDRTAARAVDTASIILDRPVRRGSGAALKTGLIEAFDRGAAYAVTIDADGQHDPSQIPSVLDPVLTGDADIAQGVRSINSAEVSGERARSLGVWFFSYLMRWALKVDSRDPSNGFRAISKEAFYKLSLSEEQFYVGELIVESARSGLRVAEVPVTVLPRLSGESKKPRTALYGLGFARGIFRAARRSTRRRTHS